MYLRQEKTLTLTFTCKECSQNRLLSTCLYASRNGPFSFEPVEIVTSKTRQLSSQGHHWNCTLDVRPALFEKAPEWKHKQQSCHIWWKSMNFVWIQLYDLKQAILAIESKECAHFVSFVSVSTGSQFSSFILGREKLFLKKKDVI